MTQLTGSRYTLNQSMCVDGVCGRLRPVYVGGRYRLQVFDPLTDRWQLLPISIRGVILSFAQMVELASCGREAAGRRVESTAMD